MGCLLTIIYTLWTVDQLHGRCICIDSSIILINTPCNKNLLFGLSMLLINWYSIIRSIIHSPLLSLETFVDTTIVICIHDGWEYKCRDYKPNKVKLHPSTWPSCCGHRNITKTTLWIFSSRQKLPLTFFMSDYSHLRIIEIANSSLSIIIVCKK